MIIPPSADRFLTSSYFYQIIKILFVKMKKMLNLSFLLAGVLDELGKNVERVRWKNLPFIL